ncbi:MAG: hypothetical protein JXA21_17370 [Anaerolineae bacterium]|nr:hypothetical protein [Anaerolineae bacterium]
MTQTPFVPPTVERIADLDGVYGTHLAFDREGKRWALADNRSIQLGRDSSLDRQLIAGEPIYELTWSADDKRLFAGPQIYDLEQDKWQRLPALDAALVAGLDHPPSPERFGVVAAAFAPDGGDLVIAARFRPTRELGARDDYTGPWERLLLLDSDRALRGELYAGSDERRAIAVGEKFIAAGGATVQIWDRSSLRKVCELEHHKLVVRALAFSAAGDLLATLAADGEVALWNPSAGRLLKSFPAHSGDGYAIAFHPTEPLLATGGQDGALRLWAFSGRSVYEESLGGWVQAVAFSRSGTRLAAVARSFSPHLAIYALSAPS